MIKSLNIMQKEEIPMLKKLQNKYEKLTHDYVKEVCDKYDADVYPKVRLADVFEISGSGISKDLYRYALMSHFDTIIFNSEQDPLFAVEFDGSTHIYSPEQIERDQKKNELCNRFELPLLRITSDFLHKQYRGVNLLSWFIEVWFASEWFHERQKKGKFAPDEPFMPMSFKTIPGKDEIFPLWLSRDVRGEVANLKAKGHVESFCPTTLVCIDQFGDFHCLAWVVIENMKVVFTMNKLSGQQFPAPMHELLEDITVVELVEKLENVLTNKETFQTISQLNFVIKQYKEHYQRFSGGGERHELIGEW
ncbi:hypothetical protein CN930_12880 [Bacillus cereus]|nr:hypothetical protein CON40_26570 [Bacillus cereus]PGL38890.1 hypothetical protein CN930_12880 [Bacillus cereus]